MKINRERYQHGSARKVPTPKGLLGSSGSILRLQTANVNSRSSSETNKRHLIYDIGHLGPNSLFVHDNVLYHALSRRHASPGEDGEAMEFQDLGEGVLAIYAK
jgi:hypothetical protein